MVETRFLGQDQARWSGVLSDLQQVFRMPLALLPLDDPALPADRRADIREGRTVVLGLKELKETYFKSLGDSRWVFRAGPLEAPWILRYFDALALALLALVIALAAYLWVRPVWRDLTHIDRGVQSFGSGDLDARLAVRKGSALSTLADTFNAMPTR